MNDVLAMLKKLGVERTDNIITNAEGEKGLSSYTKNPVVEDGISDDEYLQLCLDNKMLPDSPLLEEHRGKSLEEYKNLISSEGKDALIMHRSRILTFRGSDETVDRHGDIVRVDGWKLDDYKKNPVFLVGHDYSKMPVGRTVRVWKDSADDEAVNGRSLKFRVHFPAKEVSKEADAIFQLYKSKLLTSVSVGFMPTKMNSPQTDEERDALGLGKWGVEFTEQSLWELSAVPLPSNTNALQVNSAEQEAVCKDLGLPFQKKEMDEEMMDMMSEMKDDMKSMKDMMEEVKNMMEEMKSVKDAISSILEYINKNLDEDHIEDDLTDSDSSNEEIGKSIYDNVFQSDSKTLTKQIMERI